jgi:hypothetical protein
MNNLIPNNVPEWTTVIETMQDTNMQVRETNQLTHMLHNEQRKEFKDLRQEIREAWQQSQKEYHEIRAAIREEIRCIHEDRKERKEWRAEIQQGWEEHDRRMKEADEKRKQNWDAHVLKMEKADKKRKKDWEEHDRRMKEADEKRKQEWDAHVLRMEEADKKRKKDWEEHELSMKKADKKIRELETKFFSTTGHIIEGLMSSSSMEMFQNAGYEVWNKCKNVRRKISNPLQEMEVDVLLDGDTTAIVIEVKANCDPKDIDHLLLQMEKFRTLFPALAGKTVFLAIAAINYDYDADHYAHEKGLIVVRSNSENIFSIDDCNQDTLQRF